ncbi:PREDICTED: translocase of chloroplast 159, chloroplastic [Nelumbo nucifera]|uniref:Translocase of chloroplast 159, chloroplastic n=1 Tax=Nelumbo nucifera TaxID=4432 RepID=A0A1U8A456_NELNU|nr:PREDICTED: translocase of chloroplast 159, chloroplastic [Nelumbo nucifera]
MDSQPSVPLYATQSTPSPAEESQPQQPPSGSPGIGAPPPDFDIETSIENVGDKQRNRSSFSSRSSDYSYKSEGFMSGEDEFETASERHLVAEPEEGLETATEGEHSSVPFVQPVLGSSIFPLPKTAVPIKQQPRDDGDVTAEDEELVSEVEDQRILGLVGFPSVAGLEESGGVDELSLGRDFASVEVLNSGSLRSGLNGYGVPEPLVVAGKDSETVEEDGSNEEETLSEGVYLDEDIKPAVQESYAPGMQEVDGTESEDKVLEENYTVKVNSSVPVVEELVSSNFVEADNMSSVTGGDSVDETRQAILLGLGSGVGDKVHKQENGVSETQGVEQSGETSLILGTWSDQPNPAVEHPVVSKLMEADTDVTKIEDYGALEHETAINPVHEAIELGPLGPKTDMVEVVEIDGLDTGSGFVDFVMNVSANDQNQKGKKDGVVDPSVSINEVGKVGKPELETEQQTTLLSVNEVDSESGGNKIQSVDSNVSSMEPVVKEKYLENGDASVAGSAQSDQLEDRASRKSETPQSMVPVSILDSEVKLETEAILNPGPEEEDYDDNDDGSDNEGPVSDEDAEGMIFGISEAAKQMMKELEQGSGTSSHSGAQSYLDHPQRIEGQIATDSDDEVDTDDEGDGKELFDSAALTALLKAASNAGSDTGSVTITSPDGSRLFSIERPAGLGSSMQTVKPAPRPNRPNFFIPPVLTAGGESEDNLSEEQKNKLEKIQFTRVKFLRLVQRLGHSPEDSIVAQVLYRMVIAAGRQTSQVFNLEIAKRTAMQLEAEGKDDLNFSLNILVLGKTGVGKSATINSIFGEQKSVVDAFEYTTTSVKEIVGSVDGVKIRVFDTPGLRSSVMEQSFNRKVLSSIKKFIKKSPPDIVLYIDRLDAQTRDLNDLPLLRSITSVLGSSLWQSAIVTLTHAATAPPDGPSGSPLSYEVFVAQRSHVVQQCIGQAVGDLRLMNPSLMNPVSLVENHPSCRKNREGQKILPNGQNWRSQLLLLCYSMKILSEVSSLSKPQDPFDHRKLFGLRVRSPPLPYLLSSLLQSRSHPKLSADQGDENGDSDVDLDFSDSDQEEEDEYDQLPPFKPLKKAQVAELSKEQRKAYFDEYDYRMKLLQKKQWREEVRRLREIKKKGKADGIDYGYMGEDVDQEENGSPAAVPVPLPDMVLPPSFDGDNPAYRYRFLEPTSQLLARPVLDTHGWDHDCGYDGVSLEHNLAIAGQFPAGVAVQITEDKKEFNIHLNSSVSAKHGDNGSTLAGFDIQNIGRQLGYILIGETKFKNVKKNKTAAGLSITFLGENVATGLKIEDQIAIGKRLVLVGSTGAVQSQGDIAYGANLEARLKEKDYPIGQDQSTLSLSLMRWRGDLALGANLQSQFSLGRNSKMAVRMGLNNKLSGQITVRTSCTEQLQIALVGILPIASAIFRTIWPTGETYSVY